MTASLLLTFVEGDVADKLSIILDPAFARTAVWLIHTPNSVGTAGNLMAAVRSRDATRQMRAISLSNCWDSAAVETALASVIAEATAEPGTQVLANLSDGPGVAGFIAERLLREAGIERFVVDPRSDRVVWLRASPAEPRSGKPAARPIADTLSLYEYLHAHGFHVRSCVRHPPAGRSGVTRAILRASPRVSSLLQTLATSSEPDENGRFIIRDSRVLEHSTRAILAQLAASGLVELGNNDVALSDAGVKSYLAGGWLEYHVGQSLERMQAAGVVQHYLMNATVEDGHGSMAEIDAAFLANNNLFVVECKAQRNAKSRTWLDALYAIANRLEAKGVLALNADLLPTQSAMAAAKSIALIGRAELLAPERLEERFLSIIHGVGR